MTSSSWRQIKCADCSGHGLVSGYTADDGDFTGAEECRACAGSGSVWVRAKGVRSRFMEGRSARVSLRHKLGQGSAPNPLPPRAATRRQPFVADTFRGSS
jgi:hypothetical protein